MNINNNVNLMMGRSRALRQAKTRAASRLGRNNTSARLSGNSRSSMRDFMNNTVSSDGSALSNMQNRSNYTMIVKAAEDLQHYADKLLGTGVDSLFGKANPIAETDSEDKTEEGKGTETHQAAPEGTEESGKAENTKPTPEELEEAKNDVISHIKKFINEYNDMTSRLSKTNDSSSSWYLKELKSFVKDNKFELSNMGITLETNGTLKVDSKKLQETDISKIQKQFGDKGGFAHQVAGLSKSICASAKAQLEKLNSSSRYLPSSNYNRYGSALLPHQMQGSYYNGMI